MLQECWWFVAVPGYPLGIAVGAVESVANRSKFAVVVVLAPREMVDRVRSRVKEALEGNHVDVVMDTEGPNRSGRRMQEHDIDVYGDEVATGEHGSSLYEGVQRVEGEPCEGGHSFGCMVDGMKVPVDLGMMQQPVSPIGQELIVADMKEEVHYGGKAERELILHF